VSTLTTSPRPLPAHRRPLQIAAFVAIPLILLGCFVLARKWPFNRDAVVKELEDTSMSRVEVGSFHKTYFPHPGCVLEHVTFRHNLQPGAPPLITASTIRIEGSFAEVFSNRVRSIHVDGLHVLIPSIGSAEQFGTPSRVSVVIDEVIANGAVLEVQRHTDPPLKFSFGGFSMGNVGGTGPAWFKAKFSNPEPPGAITASGQFGPWMPQAIGKTAVSGQYQFDQADLGIFPGIKGILSSSGKFTGSLDHIAVEGDTDVPEFAVTMSSHHTRLGAHFSALVNALNGDTDLQQVRSQFRKTTVLSSASVAGTDDGPGKTASVSIETRNGRIQDALLLFIQSPQSPMSGLMNFKAKVTLPPGESPFLKKVQLEGDFGIDEGSFTKPETQQGVNQLSHGGIGDVAGSHSKSEDRSKPEGNSKSEDDDPSTVLSDLKGHVLLRNGTAHFTQLSFTVPGATAQMQGTYSLITEKIDLRGTLKTNAEISKTTTGVKSLLMKFFDPFFKKKRAGYIAPVKIAGTYDHPTFGLDLGDSDHTKGSHQNANANKPPAPSHH
jgi:hypothetical protein